MNPQQLKTMENVCFQLFAISARGNPESLGSKMEMMRRLSDVLNIDPLFGFNTLNKLHSNKNLEQMARQADVFDQLQIPDQPIDKFDSIMSNDFKYKPDTSSVRIKQDYCIPEKIWEDLDFNVYEDVLLSKQNQMTKFAKFYNQRQHSKYTAKQIYNIQRMLLVTAEQGLKRYCRKYEIKLPIDLKDNMRLLIKQIMQQDTESSSSGEDSSD